MEYDLTSDVEGKCVVDPEGNAIGIVKSVDNGLAYVKPDPSITGTVRAKLGLGETSRHAYPLDSNKVDRITSDQVHLRETPDFGAD